MHKAVGTWGTQLGSFVNARFQGPNMGDSLGSDSQVFHSFPYPETNWPICVVASETISRSLSRLRPSATVRARVKPSIYVNISTP